MIKVCDFNSRHMLRIDADNKSAADLDPTLLRQLTRGGRAYSAIDDVTHEVLMCVGATEVWEGRWIIWALMAKGSAGRMIRLTSIARRLLNTVSGRLEAYVVPEFELGHKWAQLLGFTCETPRAKSFMPGGGDAAIYVRVNDHGMGANSISGGASDRVHIEREPASAAA